MVVDSLDEIGQPERLGVRDEMDLMAASGKRDAQFGRDDAGAAVDGVTRDADLQGTSLRTRMMIRCFNSARGAVASSQTAPGGSWCRSQVSCRRAYRRVARWIAFTACSRVHAPWKYGINSA
jgi:hypothetical protein